MLRNEPKTIEQCGFEEGIIIQQNFYFLYEHAI